MPTLGLWEFILDHVMASAVLASLGPGPLVPRPSGPRGLLVLRSSAPLLCSYGMNDAMVDDHANGDVDTSASIINIIHS